MYYVLIRNVKWEIAIRISTSTYQIFLRLASKLYLHEDRLGPSRSSGGDGLSP